MANIEIKIDQSLSRESLRGAFEDESCPAGKDYLRIFNSGINFWDDRIDPPRLNSNEDPLTIKGWGPQQNVIKFSSGDNFDTQNKIEWLISLNLNNTNSFCIQTIKNASSVNALTITSDGKIGIGYAYPTAKLYIQSNENLTGLKIISNELKPEFGSKELWLQLLGNSSSQYIEYLEISHNRHTELSMESPNAWAYSEIKLQKRINESVFNYVSFKGSFSEGLNKYRNLLTIGFGDQDHVFIDHSGNLGVKFLTISNPRDFEVHGTVAIFGKEERKFDLEISPWPGYKKSARIYIGDILEFNLPNGVELFYDTDKKNFSLNRWSQNEAASVFSITNNEDSECYFTIEKNVFPTFIEGVKPNFDSNWIEITNGETDVIYFDGMCPPKNITVFVQRIQPDGEYHDSYTLLPFAPFDKFIPSYSCFYIIGNSIRIMKGKNDMKKKMKIRAYAWK
ncbi:MAG: hypothetical protein JNL02_09625 [Saprospiraceae bacterium]|nr:hypothetical protein [Saprospiraceae bacterium]